MVFKLSKQEDSWQEPRLLFVIYQQSYLMCGKLNSFLLFSGAIHHPLDAGDTGWVFERESKGGDKLGEEMSCHFTFCNIQQPKDGIGTSPSTANSPVRLSIEQGKGFPWPLTILISHLYSSSQESEAWQRNEPGGLSAPAVSSVVSAVCSLSAASDLL